MADVHGAVACFGALNESAVAAVGRRSAQVDPDGEQNVGSDPSIDGSPHYCRIPPNVDGVETYHHVLLALARHLPANEARKVTSENAQRIFRLNGPTV
jgi:hypothetical protein